jgi:hypothetical protein
MSAEMEIGNPITKIRWIIGSIQVTDKTHGHACDVQIRSLTITGIAQDIETMCRRRVMRILTTTIREDERKKRLFDHYLLL